MIKSADKEIIKSTKTLQTELSRKVAFLHIGTFCTMPVYMRVMMMLSLETITEV